MLEEPKKEQYLDRFYYYLANDDEESVKGMGIPMSDVFYIRAALREKTGLEFSLEHIERSIRDFLRHDVKPQPN